MILQDIGERTGTDKALFHKYCDFYQGLLPKRSFAGRLLEIGVMDGASLRMWREYYPKAEIIGVDIALQSDLRIEGVTLLELDATDPAALEPLGAFDIIIDDGSHTTADQQTSFEHLYYNQLYNNGFYVLEDLHTSLMPNYINSKLTTLEYLDHAMLETAHYRRDPKEADSMTCIIRGGQ